MKFSKSLQIVAVLGLFTVARMADAAIIQYDIVGSMRPGLHFLNEPAVASGGTGGEIGAGVTLDNVSNLLTVTNVGWGSSNGFLDLTSVANNSHIHGPTAAANGGGGFTQTAAVLFNLTRSSSAVTGGTFTTAPILLTAAQVLELNAGRYYFNIHTATNGGGELRGFLVPAVVPEPTSLALLLASGACAVFARRKR